MKKRTWVYGMTLFLITLTGFAQMPIFKRYYIADIPGLGWLAEFYVTHALHYGLAAFLIALAVFALLDLMLSGRGLGALTAFGAIKALLVLGLIITGGMMVVRNLPGVHFSHVAIHLMNLAHLGFCMALLFVTAAGAVVKKGWLRQEFR